LRWAKWAIWVSFYQCEQLMIKLFTWFELIYSILIDTRIEYRMNMMKQIQQCNTQKSKYRKSKRNRKRILNTQKFFCSSFWVQYLEELVWVVGLGGLGAVLGWILSNRFWSTFGSWARLRWARDLKERVILYKLFWLKAVMFW